MESQDEFGFTSLNGSQRITYVPRSHHFAELSTEERFRAYNYDLLSYAESKHLPFTFYQASLELGFTVQSTKNEKLFLEGKIDSFFQRNDEKSVFDQPGQKLSLRAKRYLVRDHTNETSFTANEYPILAEKLNPFERDELDKAVILLYTRVAVVYKRQRRRR